MIRPPRRLWPLLLLAVLAAGMAALGCSENRRGTVLVPTGPRAIPEHPGGALTGRIRYDPTIFPDLDTPPFPPTRLALVRNGDTVAVITMDAASDSFYFADLPAGYYTVKASSRIFVPDTTRPVRVSESPRVLDDFTLRARTDSLNTVYIAIVGQMNGFGPVGFETGDTSLLGLALGVWTYPNDFATPLPIAAGTYRFKFVTDPTSTAGTIGWGGDTTLVLTAPVTNAPVVYGIGSARDLKVTFPVSGLYTFTLDERREVFSVQLAPTAPRMAARRTR